MAMKIITAKDCEGNQLPQEQIKEDAEALLAAHEQALQQNATWQFFGGVITVNGHEYQVT